MKTILIILLAFCGYVSAAEVKIDLDVTQVIPAPVGNWYQKDMPYHLHMTSLSAAIGIYTDRSLDGWQYGGGLGNLGRFTSDAMIHDVDNCLTNCGPISHMQGQGTEPFMFLGARKNWKDWYAEADIYAYRPNYENTNFDWYGGTNYSVGPIVSHVDHQVVNTIGLGLQIGYDFNQSTSLKLKLIPTKSTNSQTDSASPTGQAYYRPIYSSSLGFAPSIGIEYSF